MFDPRNLQPNSPGVIPVTSTFWPMYVEYEGEPVPDQIAASWGLKPMAPQTWGPSDAVAMSKHRMRRERRQRQARDKRGHKK